jgi:putative thiamine transport system permease protein
MLIRPILAAMAVGFAVSIAQYLPTLFSGGGRFATVTTEAVALSAGGNRRVLAVQSLLQTALPFCAFMLAIGLTAWYARNRQGLK